VNNDPWGLKQYNLYEQTFPAGTITLGGNLATGASSVPSMYFVIVEPYIATAEICDNGIDDDVDGLIDCADSDCLDDPACNIEILPYSEDFDDGQAQDWVVHDEAGATSTWQVINGEYFQQSTVNNPVGLFNGDTSYHIGSFSYLSSHMSLTDYKMNVKIITLYDAQYKYNGWDVGIHIRHQDENNYYRLLFNSQNGNTRFEKKENGNFSTINLNSRGYEKGEILNIEVSVVSDLIFVKSNGEYLFSFKDKTNPILSGTVALYCWGPTKFDDVTIDTINIDTSTIVISNPTSYSVETSDSLYVSAVALNVPTEVRFRLKDGDTILSDVQAAEDPAGSNFYTGQFSSIVPGNYTVEAVIIDGINEVASDTRILVGVLGDYRLSIGDSIFNGIGDFFTLDGTTTDKKIISFQGHQPVWYDLLIPSQQPNPQIIFNEAIPGHTTEKTLLSINSAIERHQKFDPNINDYILAPNKVYILLGTNDSATIPPLDPGTGCTPGVDCIGTYKGNIIELINNFKEGNLANNDGISEENITLVLIPPVFAACGGCEIFTDVAIAPRNVIIQDYNTIITDEIPLIFPNIQIGADLFNFFIDKFSVFAEYLHPNALGTQILASLMDDPSGNTLPFFLLDLFPSKTIDQPPRYKQTLVEAGMKYYIDRDYIINVLPQELEGGILIMTANDNKEDDSDSHMWFDIDRPCTVYVAYNSDAVSPPDWLEYDFFKH